MVAVMPQVLNLNLKMLGAAFQDKKQPEIMIYRKMAKPLFDPDMPDFQRSA